MKFVAEISTSHLRLKCYVIDSDSEVAVSGTCVHFIDVSNVIDILTSYIPHIQPLKYLIEI